MKAFCFKFIRVRVRVRERQLCKPETHSRFGITVFYIASCSDKANMKTRKAVVKYSSKIIRQMKSIKTRI